MRRPVGRPRIATEPTVVVRRPIWPVSLLLASEQAAKSAGMSWQEWLRGVVVAATEGKK